MPLHSITNHPTFPKWTPVSFADLMFVFVVNRSIRGAIMHPCLARNNHTAFQTSQYCPPNDRSPSIHRLHDFDRSVFDESICLSMRRPLAIGRRRSCVEVCFQSFIQIIANEYQQTGKRYNNIRTSGQTPQQAQYQIQSRPSA